MAAYDEVADAYRRALDPDGDDAVLTELVGGVSGQDVLALACGQGRDARLLAGLRAAVIGVDVSEEMLRYARELEAADPCGIEFVQGDAEDLPFAEKRFDGVVCHMALMDIPGLAATIASVSRVLRERGWFVFSIVHPCYGAHVANLSDYLLDHRYAKSVPPDWLPTHAYHRPLGQYVDVLVASGFRLERMVEVHHPAAAQDGVPGLLYARAVKD
jgi:ubiquinone/menaquinone biosynthesis C-methylase UbiE